MNTELLTTLISLLEGMRSPNWQMPSDRKIQTMLAELRHHADCEAEANVSIPVVKLGGRAAGACEKLVRNGPGQRIRAEGGKVRVAGEHEMKLLLARKLVEESQEVLALAENNGTQAATVEELADVAEVIHAFRNVMSIRKDDVRAARSIKRVRAGDFGERLVWERE